MQLGIGVDIVPVERVVRLMGTGGDRFMQRWFTPDEIAAAGAAEHPDRLVAAHLATKEATFKALRADPGRTVPWREVEVAEGADGHAEVLLSGALTELASRLGVETVHASFAHCERFAIATVVTSGTPPVAGV